MEVTRDNFDEALEIVTEAIQKGDLMAFDTEFTGFSISEDDMGHDYDSIEDRYQKLKYVCEKGKAIQFGLTTFKWHKESKEYIAQSFNFYLLKSPKSIDDKVITMKADGMNFLAQNGFDFTKLYMSGITFERLSNREILLDAWRTAIRSGDSELRKDKKKQKVLSKENMKLMNQILTEVDKMVYGSQAKLEYEIDSYLLRQKLTTTIRQKYPGMNVSYQKEESQFKIIKNDCFTPPSKLITSIQDDYFDSEEQKTGFSDTNDKLSIKELEKAHNREVIEKYRNTMGFTLVIEEMVNCNKPIIGHNCIYDICFLYDQFIAPLPETYLEFTKAWRDHFPITFDSKYVANNIKSKLFNNSQLGILFKKCKRDKSMKNMLSISIDEAPIFKRYQNESQVLLNSTNIKYAHEAGFDSYMAGSVLLCAAKYKEIAFVVEQKDRAKNTPCSQTSGNSGKTSKSKKRDLKASQKDCDSPQTKSTKQFWVDIKHEPINFDILDDLQNRIIFDLNDRYFDFSSYFNGIDKNFNTINVVWIKWCSKEKLPYEQLNWKHDKVKYETEKTEIIVQRLAEILSEYGDVSIVKDTDVSAFVEFTTFDTSMLKKKVSKSAIFKDKKILESISKKLEIQTGVSPFEVFPYEKAEKFKAEFVHD